MINEKHPKELQERLRYIKILMNAEVEAARKQLRDDGHRTTPVQLLTCDIIESNPDIPPAVKEACLALYRKGNKKKEDFSIRLSSQYGERLRQLAKNLDVSTNAIIKNAVSEYIDKHLETSNEVLG